MSAPDAAATSLAPARILSAMSAEGRGRLAGGIAERAGDPVMINGDGLPADEGGPMFATGRSDPARG